MALRGSNISVRSLQRPVILVILSGVLLLIYIFRKKMNTLSKAKEIYNLAKVVGFSDAHARFVVSQAAHETAYLGIAFNSPVYKKTNNLFGYNYVYQPLAIGKYGVYTVYESEEDSVKELKGWTERHVPIIKFLSPLNTLPQWVRYLKTNNYFTDTEENYLKGCEHWYKKIYG